LNRMEGKILPSKCAVGEGEPCRILLDEDSWESSSSYHSWKREIETCSITLGDALRRCRPGTRKILKLNCEGCEFTVISGQNVGFLAKFQRIVCFYHSYLTGISREVLLQTMSLAGFRLATAGDEQRGVIIGDRITNLNGEPGIQSLMFSRT